MNAAAVAATTAGVQQPSQEAAEVGPLGVEQGMGRKDHHLHPEPAVVPALAEEAGVAGADEARRSDKDRTPHRRDRQPLRESALSEPERAEAAL